MSQVRFFTCLIVFLVAVSATVAMAQSSSSDGFKVDARPLPSDFSGNLITLTPITLHGDTLRLFSDTGGGGNMIYSEVAHRLDLALFEEIDVPVPGQDDPVMATRLPVFQPAHAIPDPTLLPPTSWQFMVVEPPYDFLESDGFLGRTWFAGRVWLFDYPEEKIGKVFGLDESALPDTHRVTLGFITVDGLRTMHFPRIAIEVEGEKLEMLLDTGATTILSDEARDVLPGAGSGKQGTSFIVESVFEAWRENNPDWQIIEDGDKVLDMPMIEVPKVTIAGHTVGPVWFTMRPDLNFHEHMSQMMGRRIDGAVGESALKYFRMIVDYPNAWAAFGVTEK